MSLARTLTWLCGSLLLTHCTGLVPTIGEQSDVQQLYTADAPGVAFTKVLHAAEREHCTIVRQDPQAGTIHATAYRNKVTVLMLVQPVRGQTRVEALARTDPGTFSHGKLDLAARILAHYQEGL